MIANEETRAQLVPPANPIAVLNDAFRRTCAGGTLAVTAGIIALGRGALPAILTAVRGVTVFEVGNDPYNEHDFGSLDWRGTKIFWKIDCYDCDLRFASPDPADETVTARVLTIMLAEEY